MFNTKYLHLQKQTSTVKASVGSNSYHKMSDVENYKWLRNKDIGYDVIITALTFSSGMIILLFGRKSYHIVSKTWEIYMAKQENWYNLASHCNYSSIKEERVTVVKQCKGLLIGTRVTKIGNKTKDVIKTNHKGNQIKWYKRSPAVSVSNLTCAGRAPGKGRWVSP